MKALLYFAFSLAIPAMASTTLASIQPTAGHNKGFFLQDRSAENKMVIQGLVQTRLTHEALSGLTSTDDDATYFSIPRARLSLKGHLFGKNLRYKFQADFGKGNTALKDFFVDYRLLKNWLHIRAGQHKRPFSRQQINSSGKLELVDRAITDKAFSAGRDLGITLHNNFEKSPTFEYALGLFNGTGDKAWFAPALNVTQNADGAITDVELGPKSKFTNVPKQFSPVLVARIGYNYGGIKGYQEGDLTGGGLRFSLGASGLVDLDLDSDTNDDNSALSQIDYALKYQGFSTTGGLYVVFNNDNQSAIEMGKWGLHAQASYMLTNRYQPIVRYATVKTTDSNTVKTITGGLSVYFYKHQVKWQTDLGTSASGESDNNYLVRTQLQVAF